MTADRAVKTITNNRPGCRSFASASGALALENPPSRELTLRAFEAQSGATVAPRGSVHVRPARNDSDPLLGIGISAIEMRHMLDGHEMKTRGYDSFISHSIAQVGDPDAVDIDIEMR